MPKSMQNVFFFKIISNASVWYFGPLNFLFYLDCHCTTSIICHVFRQEMGQDIALFGLYLGRIWVRALLSLVSFQAGYGSGHCSLWSLFRHDLRQDIGLLGLYLDGIYVRTLVCQVSIQTGSTSGHWSVRSLFRRDLRQDIGLLGLYLDRIYVRTLVCQVSIQTGSTSGHCSL